MAKIFKKKGLVSFAVVIDVDVEKPCTDGQAKKVGEWLAKHLEVDDAAYEMAPVAIHFNPAKKVPPIRVRVCEYFN